MTPTGFGNVLSCIDGLRVAGLALALIVTAFSHPPEQFGVHNPDLPVQSVVGIKARRIFIVTTRETHRNGWCFLHGKADARPRACVGRGNGAAAPRRWQS